MDRYTPPLSAGYRGIVHTHRSIRRGAAERETGVAVGPADGTVAVGRKGKSILRKFARDYALTEAAVQEDGRWAGSRIRAS